MAAHSITTRRGLLALAAGGADAGAVRRRRGERRARARPSRESEAATLNSTLAWEHAVIAAYRASLPLLRGRRPQHAARRSPRRSSVYAERLTALVRRYGGEPARARVARANTSARSRRCATQRDVLAFMADVEERSVRKYLEALPRRDRRRAAPAAGRDGRQPGPPPRDRAPPRRRPAGPGRVRDGDAVSDAELVTGLLALRAPPRRALRRRRSTAGCSTPPPRGCCATRSASTRTGWSGRCAGMGAPVADAAGRCRAATSRPRSLPPRARCRPRTRPSRPTSTRSRAAQPAPHPAARRASPQRGPASGDPALARWARSPVA